MHNWPVNCKKVLYGFEKTPARSLLRNVVPAFGHTLMNSSYRCFRMPNPKEVSFKDEASFSGLTEPSDGCSATHRRFPREAGFARNKLTYPFESDFAGLNRN